MKVRNLALNTGYAESSSWSQLFLTHPKGFDSVQEALINIRQALLEMIKQEQEDARCSVESIRKMRKPDADPKDFSGRYLADMDDFLAATPEEAVEPTLHDIIHGTFQDHGDFWEFMAQRGWLVGNAWNTPYLGKYPTVLVDSAPEAVAECENWDSEFRLFEQVPKGIRLLKKGKK